MVVFHHEPNLDIDLHFNGDLHAITSANNLLSALIDNHIYFGNELKIKRFTGKSIDINVRSLSIQTKLETISLPLQQHQR